MGKKRWHRESEEDREARSPLSAEERYIATEDAIEQGALFVNIIQALREERRVRLASHARA